MSALIHLLHVELEHRGWTEQQLAVRAAISPLVLTAILNGRTPVPSLENLDALAYALELPLAQLITVCGFSLEREALQKTTTQHLHTLLDAAPELRLLFGDLTLLSREDLRMVRAYVQAILQRTSTP